MTSKRWFEGHPIGACVSCLAWGHIYCRQRCAACYVFDHRHKVGLCTGCGLKRTLRKQYCRLCWSQARDDARAVDASGQQVTAIDVLARVGRHQLFFANMVSLRGPRLPTRKRLIAEESACRRDTALETATTWPQNPAGAQLMLFDELAHCFPRRLVQQSTDPGNSWVRQARHLVAQHGEARGWSTELRHDAKQAVELVLAQHVDGAKVRYSALAAGLPPLKVPLDRTADILREMGILLDDRRAPLEEWLEGQLAELTPSFADDIESWVHELRDGGPRRPALLPQTARRYAKVLHPALSTWSTTYEHLREVTRADVLAELDGLHGDSRMLTLVAMRSLFSYLKKRGVIFANPTGRIRNRRGPRAVLQPLRAEQIADTVAAAARPVDPVVIALALIHAARPAAIRHLRLDDIDIGNRRLTLGGRTRPMDELTARLLLTWLDHRRIRWPNTANPHLLVNTHSALLFAPVSTTWLGDTFRREHYVTLDQMRIDRILEEALAHPGDALHIASVFGLNESSAIRFAESARQLVITAAERDTRG